MEPIAARLSGVQETLLIPLSARIAESKREDPTFLDPEAERIGSRIDADLAFFASEWTQVEAVVGRTAILDAGVKAWMALHPGGRVVNLGCGLCTRFHRLDDGIVRWFDVDLPDVIALKRQLVAETDRYRMVVGSVLDAEWTAEVGDGPALFVAEGLLMYLSEAQVSQLLGTVRDRFPGSEAWLEVISPFMLRTLGRRSRTIRRTGAAFDWGVADPAGLERLVSGLKIVQVCYPTEVHPERWRWMRVFRWVRPVHTALKCVHVRL